MPEINTQIARPVASPSAVRAICAALATALACGIVMQSVLVAGFLSMGDGAYLRQAERVGELTLADIRAAFSTYSVPAETGGYYQPLALLSLALDAKLAPDPSAAAFHFHLTNLALHLANVLIVFHLLRRFGASLWVCALGGLLFGLHPIQLASVAWVSQRGTLLGAFFALMAITIYSRVALHGRTAWVVPVTLLYTLAVLSNPLLIPLPVVFLLLDLWPGKRTGWTAIIEKAPMFAIFVIAVAIQIMVHARSRGQVTGEPSSFEVLGGSLVSFVVRLFQPYAVSILYPAARGSLASANLAAMVGVAGAIVVIGIWSFRRSRPVFTCLCGAVVLVCPALLDAAYTSSLLGDKYLYLVLIMPLIVAACSIETITHPTRRRLCLYAAAAAVAFCTSQTYLKSFTWLSSRDVFEETVRRYPAWPDGYTGLVEAWLQDGELDSALKCAERAVQIAPQDPDIQFYLGTTLLLHKDGRSAEAIAPLRKALRSNPNWIACLQNLGVALVKSGHTEKAIVYLEKARDLDPESAAIRTGLGHAYLRLQRPSAARAELQIALRHRNDPIIHLGLAMAWAEIDADEQARRHLAIALARDPHLAERAAASPALRRIGSEQELFDQRDMQTPTPALDIELPAARRAGGPTG